MEVVVNAIQATESTGRADKKIAVRIERADQLEMVENRESFDTLYSDLKVSFRD